MSLYDTIQEEGKDLGKKEAIITLLRDKFSQPLPDDLKAKIEEANRHIVETLLEKYSEIKSLDDVRDIFEE